MPPRDITGSKRKVVRRKVTPAGPTGPVGRIGPVAPKRVVRRAPGPPTGLSEQDRQKVRVYHRQITKATQDAKHGKPFNAEHLRDAIASGVAKDVSEAPGNVFLVKQRRKFLPDQAAPVTPERGLSGKNFTDPKTRKRVQEAVDTQVMGDAIHAPALKVLEATAVPSHKIAGAFGGKTFGEVLRKAGAPKALASAGGFALDVGLDPTTYVSFGAGSAARKVALSEAERVAAKAAAAGMSEAGQATVAKQAAKRAQSAAPGGKGLTVKFAGAHVPGVTHATAAGGRVVKRAAATAPQPLKNAAAGARNLVADVRPTLKPTEVAETQFHGIRSAGRQTRAQVNQQLALIEQHAHGLHRQIGPDNYATVIDAIEKGRVHKLPDNLRQPAVFLRSQFRHAQKIRRQAGLGEGSIRDYFPHAQHEPLVAGKGVDTSVPERKVKAGRIVSYPGSSKQRTLRGPISEVNPKLAAEGRGQFSTDIPLVYANYQRETAKTAASADLAKRLAAAGRPIKPGRIDPKTGEPLGFHLGEGERVYQLGFDSAKSSHVVGQTKKGGDVVVREAKGKGRFGLRPLSPQEEQALAKPGSFHPGQYVALHEKTVADAAAQSAPYHSSTAVGRTLDRSTRGFKRLATFTPGFHARNLVGDVQMGYLSQPAHKLPSNLYQAGKAVKGLHNQQKAAENLAMSTAESGNTIKVAGRDMPVPEFLWLAQQHGVTQSGAITRELQDLAESAAKGTKRTRVGGAVKRGARKVAQSPPVRALMQDRENIVRLATFKHGLDSGLGAERAASLSLGTHIDYGDLTHFERKYARRLMPFYTFSARALPLHVKALVTRPGKIANIEKAREEIGGTDVSGYTPWQRRQVPFTVGGKGVTDSLPLTLLNEVPVSKNPKDYASELFQFAAGLTNPVLRDPVEFGVNRSFTFRNDIQDPKRPLVSAPDWVGKLPVDARKELGAVQGPDKRTGKKVWLWPGKVDYALKTVALGPFNVANQLATSGTNRVGQGTAAKAVAGLTGVRIQPQDKVSVAINEKYDKLNKLTEKQAALNQQGIKAANATPEYRKLSEQMKSLEREIYALAKKRGDKVLPRAGAPPKGRGGGSVGGGFGGGFGGFGGAGFK